MSRIAEGPQPADLAEELARRPTAIATLVTLRDRVAVTIGDLGGVDEASREALRVDLCWLATTGLLRREPHGSWDVTAATGVYRLSDIGRALADTLHALAEGCRHLTSAPTLQRHDSMLQ